MFNLVKKFFEKSDIEDTKGTNEKRTQRIMVATCALLLEIAKIDGEFSDSELRNIFAIIKTDYQLSDENTKELIKAADEELKGSIDMWQFTNLVNQNYSTEEKVRTIEMLWKVVYADGKLDKHEDYLIHKLAELLHLSHKELIDAKLKVIQKA